MRKLEGTPPDQRRGASAAEPYSTARVADRFDTEPAVDAPVAATSPYSALFDHEHDARTEGLLALVGFELRKAQSKFKPFNSAHEGKAVIEEELDELWEHVKANTGDGIEAFEEAIQIAAMALRYAYDISTVSVYEVAT